MKIDLRFTLDSENEEHRKAIHVYNSLRRKHRVDFFVELTKAYWDKDLVGYPNMTNEAEVSTSPSSAHASRVNSQSKSEINALPHNSEPRDSHSLKTDGDIPKKRNPLLG